MSMLHSVSSSASGRLAATTLLCGGIGFALGFLLSLVVSAHSLYSCIAII
jgi:hypothetical protein